MSIRSWSKGLSGSNEKVLLREQERTLSDEARQYFVGPKYKPSSDFFRSQYDDKLAVLQRQAARLQRIRDDAARELTIGVVASGTVVGFGPSDGNLTAVMAVVAAMGLVISVILTLRVWISRSLDMGRRPCESIIESLNLYAGDDWKGKDPESVKGKDPEPESVMYFHWMEHLDMCRTYNWDGFWKMKKNEENKEDEGEEDEGEKEFIPGLRHLEKRLKALRIVVISLIMVLFLLLAVGELIG